MIVTTNKVVSLNYTLKNSEGEILDTSDGKEPLVYLHGVGGLIPGLEDRLEGHKVGVKLDLVIPAEEAYGTHRDELLHVVPKSGFQGEGEEEMVEGMRVQLQTEQGPAIATISKIEGEDVTLDLNHPLADLELHFNVEIVELREASEEEVNHGHAHGPGGHHH